MRIGAPRHTHVMGHFGELIQGRMGAQGPVALITLPCPVLTVQARYVPARDFLLHAPQRMISRRDAAQLLRALGAPLRGRFSLRADMPPGGGGGASSAALMALARLLTPDLAPGPLARLCLRIEGATDPLCFAQPEQLLWASRQAEELATLPPLPRMEILGGFTQQPRRTDPMDMGFPDITDLIGHWRQGAQGNALPRLAQLASLSATRTLDMRGEDSRTLKALAQRSGALGFVIAHTGSARGLIFAPGQVPAEAPAQLRAAGLRGLVRFQAGGQP